MLTFATTYLEAGNINEAYSCSLTGTGGTSPYQFAITSGSLPTGLSMDDYGKISGTPTELGLFNVVIKISDSAVVPATYTSSFQFTVMDLVSLSDITIDQGQFVQQYQQNLSTANVWSTGLTVQTSQTLIELISALGTFLTGRILRAKEDAFSSTVQSDSAIRAIATMQGLRLSRKLPATITVTMQSTISQSLAPYTQFTAGGYSWFNSEQITLYANVPITVVLREGTISRYSVNGTGKDLQAWISPEDSFAISDQHVELTINSVVINKAFGGIWNYSGADAYADLTTNDGRLMLHFGSQGYGSVPKVNDVMVITYAVTQGDLVNSVSLIGSTVSQTSDITISGTVKANPSGGASEKSPLAYKNFTAGTFGTYSSAVTKAQYASVINNYPGIVDCVTQAQREINPAALQWMNVIRVAGLTNSTWSQTQINDFISYLQSITMYSTRFVWQTPVPIYRDIDLSVYCYNSVSSTAAITALVKTAINKLISARAGILMTDLYDSDLVTTAINAAPGQISYVVVNKPTSPMLVSAPTSPRAVYTVSEGSGGSLSPALYAYSIAVDAPSPANDGTNDLGSPATWCFPQVHKKGSSILLDWSANAVDNATAYHVWGRLAGKIGIIASLPGTVTSFTDDGSFTPSVLPVNQFSEILIRYNKINSLTVNTYYSTRQSAATFPVRDTL